jgi:hypothetical protein
MAAAHGGGGYGHDGHGDQGGHGGHHGPSPVAWVATHLGGAIVPFGEWFERRAEGGMFLIVNGFFLRAAAAYLIIFTPVILIEFLITYARL